ncbi:MAG: PilZ domain-containing protein [Candidatus Accumulibacter sp.]|uniref:PilZ domain-containing protein n=1 Tax=Accumulibacter sp. TaxID=2053492 RepID=UPI001D9E023C|nr:PilZ domain-containing protein [Accumulibacter sp.]MCB1941900.1 PilZ domain-containing protein [Accumulibacter sp.]MCP5247007.1 PilZ domain-containing protein [Accumulibacter sp.]
MSEQRRNYSRIAFDCPARLSLGESQLELRVLDLSLRGALVRLPGDAVVRPGTVAELRISLDRDGTEIRMQSRVAHADGRHAGLACQSIDLDSVSHLRRLVELNLGDPELLQRELSALLNE